MAAETGLVQFQPTAELLVTTDEKAQGITNKYLVTIDTEALYQSANIGPSRKGKISRIQQNTQGLLLFPADSGFELNTSIRLQPDRYGQYIKGVDTFTGQVNGNETSSFVISIENNQLNGQIRLGEYLLKLSYNKAQREHLLSLI